jgi:DmsE family decaheme c-type cytochrome
MILNSMFGKFIGGGMILVAMWAAAPQLLADEPEARMAIEEAETQIQDVRQGDYTKRGADTCLKCHDEDNEYPVFPIFKTKHAVSADERTPFAGLQCEACHGPGSEHAQRVRSGETRAPILNFGKDSWTPAKEQNRKCLECHENHQRIEWKGSLHESNDVACASCHQIHVANDPVLDNDRQPDVCYQCHRSTRAQFYQYSHHPVREGKMTCSACHDPHGDDGSDRLVKSTLRETCTGCHAEWRGPFLWEHAPATEDCGLCHQPHGSNQPALLKKRPPQLCQQCHSQAGHPSLQYDGNAVSSRSQFTVIKGCLNCHFQVHGSNHPSGVKLMR